MFHITSQRSSFLCAVGLHIALFLALFMRLVSSPVQNLELQPDVNIIKAVAINPADMIAQQTKLAQQQKEQQEAVEKAQEAQKLLEQQQQAKALAEQHEKEAQAAAQKKAAQVAAQKQALKKAEAAALLAEQQAEQKALAQKAVVQKKQAQKAATEKAAQQKQAEQKKQAQKATSALKLAQQKELDQQMAAEKKELDAARTNQQQSEIEKFTALMLHTMRQNWIVPESVDPSISCQLSIKLNSDGKVLSVTLLRSSGNAALDNSARLAVFKSSPLPVPADPDIFNKYFKEFNLTLSPRDIS